MYCTVSARSLEGLNCKDIYVGMKTYVQYENNSGTMLLH